MDGRGRRESTTTPIHDGPIEHKMAWRGDELSREDVSFDLTRGQAAALEEVLDRVRPLRLTEITRAHASHPALDGPLSRVLDEIQFGRGLVLLRGIPVAGYSDDDVEKMYCALSTHLGKPLSQNPVGLIVKRVQDDYQRLGRVPDKAFAIANKPLNAALPPLELDLKRNANPELIMHSDVCEVLSLLCVRAARVGGESQFTSGLAIHNQIQATRPDILPTLYRGFPYRRSGMSTEDPESLTRYNVPVFCNVDGNVSMTFITGNILQGLEGLGATPTDEELEALIIMQEVADDLRFEFRLEAGEAAVANNRTTLHSRSAYFDWDEPEKRRLLLRFWLEADRDRRPVIPQINIFENTDDRSGCDAAGGDPASFSEAYSVPTRMLERMKAVQAVRDRALERT